MSYWMMMVVACGALLALGLLFASLVIALDDETQEETPQSREERRWTSIV